MAFYDWEWSCTYCGQRFPCFRAAADHERSVHPVRARDDAARRIQAWCVRLRSEPGCAARRIQRWFRRWSDGFVFVEADAEKNPCC